MSLLGFDAMGRLSGAAIVAAKGSFVWGYVGTPPLTKNLAPETLADWLAHDLAVGFIFERYESRATEGFAAGAFDAAQTMADLRRLGVPTTVNATYAVDEDDDPAAVVAYFRGIMSVAKGGVYGSFKICRYLLDNDLVTHAWQATAWSGGQWDSRCVCIQRVGTVSLDGVDADRNEAESLGNWTYRRNAVEWSDILTLPDGSNQAYKAADWLTWCNVKAGKAEANSMEALTRIDEVETKLTGEIQDIGRQLDLLKSTLGTGTPVTLSPADRAVIVAELRADLREALSGAQTALAAPAAAPVPTTEQP